MRNQLVSSLLVSEMALQKPSVTEVVSIGLSQEVTSLLLPLRLGTEEMGREPSDTEKHQSPTYLCMSLVM